VRGRAGARNRDRDRGPVFDSRQDTGKNDRQPDSKFGRKKGLSAGRKEGVPAEVLDEVDGHAVLVHCKKT
jgi:hypothetical protein